jgi:ABC-type antimicrobial peptide transport system permease subunit
VKGTWLRVVGVARAIRSQNFAASARPYFYVPLRQNPSPVVALHIRTPVGAAAIRLAVVREIHSLDGNIAPGELITMREQIERTTGSQRIALTMLIVFGAIALLLAAIGLYGVMAASVAQGTRQMAVRMALGADARQMMRLVLAKGLGMTAIGVAVGVGCALGSTRLMGYLLYRVSPTDPAAFGVALVLVGVAAAAACIVPARRAIRTDPVRVLRA